MIILNVPYNQKEQAKAAGAKWNWSEKFWMIRDDQDPAPFKQWMAVPKEMRIAKPNTLLTIELVPETCWFSNVRDHVDADQWKTVKKTTFKNASYMCEVCGGVGDEHPVECHEIWDYDDTQKVQTLKGTIALCPSCHEVKHIGFANTRGRGAIAEAWLKQINQWSEQQTDAYIHQAFEVWKERSKKKWTLNLDWLNQTFNLNIQNKR